MHDWTLVSVLFDWGSGNAVLEFRTSGSLTAKLVARGVADLHVPRLNEWGPSVSVNQVVGPSDSGTGRRALEIEMQSGDRKRISAAYFEFPQQANIVEPPVAASAGPHP